MVIWKLAEIVRRQGWTGYRLAQETGLTVQAAYRLLRLEEGQLSRVEVSTLNRLCRALKVQPGDLLGYEPDGAHRRKR